MERINYYITHTAVDSPENYAYSLIFEEVSEAPTAYDKEKVIEEIEGREEASMKEWRDYDDENAFGEMNAYAKAVEIVERGGIE